MYLRISYDDYDEDLKVIILRNDTKALLMSTFIVSDKVFFAVAFFQPKSRYFSYFSTKTYVVILIRSASPRHFK